MEGRRGRVPTGSGFRLANAARVRKAKASGGIVKVTGAKAKASGGKATGGKATGAW